MFIYLTNIYSLKPSFSVKLLHREHLELNNMSFESVLLLHKDSEYWINIPLEADPIKKAAATENQETDSELLVVWETAVQPLTDAQRLIFFSLTIIVAVIAVLGNILVICVNISRKQRFLFRACLLSLAASDLIYVAVTSSIYLSKFHTKNSALWLLGPLACSLIPFLQTLVVLVNSILLVCISLDRYMAVVRIVKGSWEPSKIFCVTCCVLIWGFSAAVSSPLLTLYDYFTVYIVPVPDPEEENPTLTYYVRHLCGSDKAENGYFFAIIFSFIFAPLIITFFWLNSVLAKEVWKRRIDVSVSVVENENTSTATNVPASKSQESYTSESTTRRVERKQRQIRMFKVILALMLVFFICRLPNWIYVLYKLNNTTKENYFWVINYSLGLVVMANCMLNPFLYTFLSETIRLTTFLTGIVCGMFRPCVKLCKCRKANNESQDARAFEKSHAFNNM